MQKTMMILVLSLLIIMACFSLLSSLVMMVKDRQSEIAILRTMGFSRYQETKFVNNPMKEFYVMSYLFER